MEQHYPKQWKNRMTTGESIAAELRFQIVNSTLEPDTLLTENQVAKQFDVSRSPVRDANESTHSPRTYGCKGS